PGPSRNLFLLQRDKCESVLSVVTALLSGLFSGLNETFIFINISMKWTEAQTYCRDNHTDLASVRNLAENQKIQDLVPSQGIVWIGLFRDGWKWSHGTHSSFTNWKQGEPKLSEETCVAANFSADGQWQVSHCQDMRPFICYTGKIPFTYSLHVDFSLIHP
uniref:C-type lectin domain-containing protein n=1 Tax=Gasterosteus aculeatus aculeatus TaxID=481459 RepID=G3N5T6_GASAC